MGETMMEMLQFLVASFQRYSGENKIWLLYPPALLAIFLLGKKSERRLFGGALLIECLTVFNPLVMDVLLELFDLSSRYRRFFWMVPFFITIAYGMVLVIFRLRAAVLRILATGVCLAAILYLGTPVFFGENVPPYQTADNSYFISDEVLELAAMFHSEGLERPRILCGGLMLSYRQYDPTVSFYISRNAFQKLQGNSLEEYLKLDTVSRAAKNICRVFYYGDYSVNPRRFYRLVKKRADYIVSQSPELDEYLQRMPVSLLGQTQNYRVWKILEKDR